MIKRALISVSDKSGILDFAKQLVELGIELLSTGGTAKLLKEANIPATEVADYTGFPEIMSGRVKTLHPKIHGALLARPGIDDADLATRGFNLHPTLVVNLLPFEKTVANPDCDLATAIETIDIGGPTMLRAGAKNHEFITVVVDANDYARVLHEIKQQRQTSRETRLELAQKVFAHTAHYDKAIANYLQKQNSKQPSLFPDNMNVEFTKIQEMRYGENPHQKAAFYRLDNTSTGTIANAIQVQGKELSFNNINDADAALECVKSFTELPACVIVKHANPCGVAVAADQLTAYHQAFATDKTSAFGGIIAFNQSLTAGTAQTIIQNQFAEVIIAPHITEGAKTILKQKPNIRVLACGEFIHKNLDRLDCKRVNGGILIQEVDNLILDPSKLKVVSHREPSPEEYNDLLFAWKVVKFVKSNAIVYAKNQATLALAQDK